MEYPRPFLWKLIDQKSENGIPKTVFVEMDGPGVS